MRWMLLLVALAIASCNVEIPDISLGLDDAGVDGLVCCSSVDPDVGAYECCLSTNGGAPEGCFWTACSPLDEATGEADQARAWWAVECSGNMLRASVCGGSSWTWSFPDGSP